MERKIKIAYRPSVTDTLLAIPAGETVVCAFGDIRPERVRTEAHRLGKAGKGLFTVNGCAEGVRVTRLK